MSDEIQVSLYGDEIFYAAKGGERAERAITTKSSAQADTAKSP